MAIIGYARVSTVGQSLDAQLIQLEKAVSRVMVIEHLDPGQGQRN